MIKITNDLLLECAHNLKFDVDIEQADLLKDEFVAIAAQMEYLAAIHGIDEVEPLTFPLSEHQTRLFADEPEEPVAAEVQLSNTSNKLGNQIRIPKVLG